PLHLQPYFHLVEVKLPEEEALYRLQTELGENLNIRPNRKAARLATGLTEFQAETAYSLSLTQKGYFSSRTVTAVKTQMIKKSGLLEVIPSSDISEVGGLEPLKAYVRNRAQAYLPDSALPRPKGILLVGVPGTGKSKTASAIASMLQFPLIRLDVGSLKNSLVGESERRMREATKIIDAFGNCVLFLDELEKMQVLMPEGSFRTRSAWRIIRNRLVVFR
ncbi:MAG: AAA family ATPase, partial [Oscillospiraceae bacterium]|nr:AAA family ATPase [Oscillospiraceae bacterium]